jgi:exosome complex RNA-binding protein Rrp4
MVKRRAGFAIVLGVAGQILIEKSPELDEEPECFG